MNGFASYYGKLLGSAMVAGYLSLQYSIQGSLRMVNPIGSCVFVHQNGSLQQGEFIQDEIEEGKEDEENSENQRSVSNVAQRICLKDVSQSKFCWRRS